MCSSWAYIIIRHHIQMKANFLLPNITSIIQSVKHGVISSKKWNYHITLLANKDDNLIASGQKIYNTVNDPR